MGTPSAIATTSRRRPNADSAGAEAGGKLRVLLLEDDPVLGYSFSRHLRSLGHHVDGTSNLSGARHALASTRYDCLVLDRLVADGDSLDLVTDLRDQPGRPPVLVISNRGEVDERVHGLRTGADDYVAKPLPLAELAMRVHSLGACGAAVDWGPVRLGSVVVDRDRHRVTADGEELHLTPHQHAVLDYLVVHRERMVPTEELLEHCWDGKRPMFANPLHSQVTRLRAVFRGRLRIEAVRGVGYALTVDDATPALAGLGEVVGSR